MSAAPIFSLFTQLKFSEPVKVLRTLNEATWGETRAPMN
jgi:hypothetical protein